MLKYMLYNKNKTWTIVDVTLEKQALICKWVYKIKYNSYGTLDLPM